jgi:hypothetical protein
VINLGAGVVDDSLLSEFAHTTTYTLTRIHWPRAALFFGQATGSGLERFCSVRYVQAARFCTAKASINKYSKRS